MKTKCRELTHRLNRHNPTTLATRSGLPLPRIQELQAGDDPTLNELCDLAHALNTTADQLVKHETTPHPQA